ncbi:MAG: methyltransferase domain-containing protein [Pseudomonadota bacterium]
MNMHVSSALGSTTALTQEPVVHSPYLVAKLKNQAPNLYGKVKFAIVSEKIRQLGEELGRPPRVLDLGCSTSISREYLEQTGLDFEYCGVDYESTFDPDVVMDVRKLYVERHRLPWTPDVILLLDVLEHLPGKDEDIRKVMRECDRLIPEHGMVMVIIPQLYRLDRLKLAHLNYPEHEVRFTLKEWMGHVGAGIDIAEVKGIGYLSVLPYLPMLSPWYTEGNRHGRLFRYLRGTVFEWAPFKPAEIALTKLMGRLGILKGWCNSSLMVCKGRKAKPSLVRDAA